MPERKFVKKNNPQKICGCPQLIAASRKKYADSPVRIKGNP
jgi:hypothetical protein